MSYLWAEKVTIDNNRLKVIVRFQIPQIRILFIVEDEFLLVVQCNDCTFIKL